MNKFLNERQYGSKVWLMDAEIAALLASLKEADERLYRYSIEQIKQIGRAAYDAILETFQNAEEFHALNLIFLMSELHDSFFLETLIIVLREKNERLRVSAAYALGLLEDKRATPALLAVLNDKNADLRRTAVWSLGEIKDPASFDALCVALRDVKLPVREEAVLALGALGDRRAIEPLKALLRDREIRIVDYTFQSLIQFGADIFGFLIGLLEDEKESLEIQRHAIICIGKLRDKRALPVLEEVLKRDEAQLMESAIEALGQIGSAEAVEMLIPLLLNRIHAIKVAEMIVKIGRSALEILFPAVDTPEAALRERIAEILGKIGDNRALETLIALLSDKDPSVIRAAIVALGDLRDKRAIPSLLAMLCQETPAFRAKAAQSIGQLRDTDSVEALMLALMDEEYGVRTAAAWALGQIRAKRAVPLLLARLNDSHYSVVESAVYALGEIADTWAVPALAIWLSSGKHLISKRDLKKQTAETLRKMGSTEALKVLHDYELDVR